MRKSNLLLVAILVFVTGMQTVRADEPLIEQLIQAKKVHRVTVYNGLYKSVHYIRLTELTSEEKKALREASLVVPGVVGDIRVANYGPFSGPQMVISVLNGAGVDKIEGRIVGKEGEWLIVDRGDGIERIRENLVVRIYEPNPLGVKPAIGDR